MKKQIDERTAARRLKLRREILRTLDMGQIAAVAGGYDPQCMATRTSTHTQ
jgi:hypothetical protein